jgi:hypothetical protein
MTLPTPFAYAAEPHQRKHGPSDYANYQEFKPWLRDDFLFRCVYCLEREMWYPDRANSFSADHVIPQSEEPARVCDYGNLVYACTRCNSFKQNLRLPDPTTTGFGTLLQVAPDAIIQALSPAGALLVRLLHLNDAPALVVRRHYLKLLALKRDFPEEPRVYQLFLEAFGYPEDLPDLAALRPPGGNSRDANKQTCFHALRQKGTLAATY